MIKVMTFLRRRPGLTRDVFLDGWLNHHAPLVLRTEDFARHVRGYHQNHAVASIPVFAGQMADDGYDGCAELWFDSSDALQQALSAPGYGSVIRPDEQRWFADLTQAPVILSHEHVIMPVRPGS